MGVPANLWASLIQSGTLANMPTTPESIAGCFYYATDIGNLFFWNGTTWGDVDSNEPPVVLTASKTAPAGQNLEYIFNAVAGLSLTLPPATGSGDTIGVTVGATLTSGAYKILSGSDAAVLYGTVIGFQVSSGAVLAFQSLIATANFSLALAFTTAVMGNIGDHFTFTDVAVGQWLVTGTYAAVGTAATTPFSTSKT